MHSKARRWLAGIGAGAVFLYVLFSIALEPLVSGDIYPRLSSMRADPLGAKALYDSLRETPGLQVSQSFKPLAQVEKVDGTMLLLGFSAAEFTFASQPFAESWRKVMLGGGRLAIAFLPERPRVDFKFPKLKPDDSKEENDKKEAAKKRAKRLPSGPELLGLTLQIRPGTLKESGDAGGMGRETALYFEPVDPGWVTLERAEDGKPMIVERAFGKGSMILVAGSYPISNEGLRNGRNTALIARMIGPSTRIVFDESHLGIVETGSVGSMIRRYGLQGAALMLMLLGLLFIWKMSSSLLPPKRIEDPTVLEGEAANAGLALLMRRSVPRSSLLSTCWNEWERSARLRPFVAPSRQAKAQEQLADADPVRGYKNIQKALSNQS